jgi:hypothetical protein
VRPWKISLRSWGLWLNAAVVTPALVTEETLGYHGASDEIRGPMSFWTDIIAYSPTWVDVHPDQVARFVTGVAGGSLPAGLVRVSVPELTCYGVHDVDGRARREATNPNMKALVKKLVEQAKRAERIDCDATGDYEPPSWTEESDEHVGPYLCVEGSPSKITRVLASAAKVPFAELDLSGLKPGKAIADALTISGDEGYLAPSELELEVGPGLAAHEDKPPVFAGWLRLILSGEGQPYPLTPQQLIERAQGCESLSKLVALAGKCFGVPRWEWTISCTG